MTVRAAITATVAALLAGAAAAGAQDVRVPGADVLRPREFVAAPVGQTALSLGDAVRLALLHSPVLSAESQRVHTAAGRAREVRGPFDVTLAIGPRLDYTQHPANPFLLDQERLNRDTTLRLAQTFSALADDLRRMATALEPRSPRCPNVSVNLSANFMNFMKGSTTSQQSSVYFDYRDEQEVRQLGITRETGAGPLAAFQSLIGPMNICAMQGGPDPIQEIAAYYQALDRISRIDWAGGYGLRGVLDSVGQAPREARTLQAQIADTVAARARLAYERLGAMPVDELQRKLTFSAMLSRAFRNGVRAAAGVELEGFEHNYRGKPFDPTFGGLAQPGQFPSKAALSLDVPLGRGRGSTSAAAPARAAEAALGAGREGARHAASEEVFRTVLAYLGVAAAQQRLAFLEESAARQERLATLAEQQVTGGDLPAMELGRVKARAATIQALLRQARADLVRARTGLAGVTGLPAADAGLLAAGEGLATARAIVPAAGPLIGSALELRRDVRAARQLQQASAILSAGAQADQRRRFDLSIATGVQNLYESEYFRFLPDEQDPIYSDFSTKPTRRTPVRFYSLRGFGRSVSLRWEPFIDVQLTVDLPFGNNAARGRAAQAQADLRAREIETVDLERVVRHNVTALRGALDRAAAALDRAEETVRLGEQVLEGTLTQFEVGEATLMDTLLTEEALTRDKLDLVRLREAYLATLARLRFETGSLLLVEHEGTGSEAFRFVPAEFVGVR